MGRFHDKRMPGESDAYRAARDELLEMEMDLRDRVAAVAAKRQVLPEGGALKEDYVFEEGADDLSDAATVRPVRLSELFAPGKPSLVLYSFMYGPDDTAACPMCTSFLDSLEGSAPHVRERVNLAVVAKAPIAKIRAWARARGWINLRLLSSANNTYNLDYFAETPAGDQLPDINVFTKTESGVHHTYNSELFFVPPGDGQDPRHADMLWPLWNLFDLTPEGRGVGWYPRVSYDKP